MQLFREILDRKCLRDHYHLDLLLRLLLFRLRLYEGSLFGLSCSCKIINILVLFVLSVVLSGKGVPAPWRLAGRSIKASLRPGLLSPLISRLSRPLASLILGLARKAPSALPLAVSVLPSGLSSLILLSLSISCPSSVLSIGRAASLRVS